MPNTPNYNWPVPTPNGDEGVWDVILNSLFDTMDNEVGTVWKPTFVGASQDNYANPTNYLVFNADVLPLDLSGVVAGRDGEILIIENLTPFSAEVNLLSVLNESLDSDAANRFVMPNGEDLLLYGADTEQTAGDRAIFVYSTGVSRWQLKEVYRQYNNSTISNGWVFVNETWTYASADSPTFTFTISGDLTTKYYPGMRLKLTQTTVKYFIITAVSFGGGNTTVTVYGGTDYTLANAAITLPFYSMAKSPAGFPMSPAKWRVTVTDTTQRSQGSPTNGTWYNLGSISIDAPIGVWNSRYYVLAESVASTNVDFSVTLSTANNSESNALYSTRSATDAATVNIDAAIKNFLLDLSSKTTHYINTRANNTSTSTIYNRNELVPLEIILECAYL